MSAISLLVRCQRRLKLLTSFEGAVGLIFLFFGKVMRLAWFNSSNIGRFFSAVLVLVGLVSIPSYSQDNDNAYLPDGFIKEKLQDYLLRTQVSNGSLLKFYEERQFEPLWYNNSKKLAQLNKAIVMSEDHGLPVS